MWFKTLPPDDQQLIVDAFKSDGFAVRKIDSGIIAEKNGQKIIVTRLDNAKLVMDLKNYLQKRNLLANEIGGIDFYTILKFTIKEKRLKESYIDCLNRVSAKFNWASVSTGHLELSGELGRAVGTEAQYLEVETDDGQLVTLLSIKNNDGDEKMYATNKRFFQLVNQLNNFDYLEAFRDLAPHAYLTLQAINVE